MPSFKDELQVLSRCIQEGQGLLLTGYATDADDKWSLEILGGHERDGSIRQLLKEHLLEFSLPTWSWEVEVGSSVSSAVDLMKCSSLQKPKCLVDFLRGNDTK